MGTLYGCLVMLFDCCRFRELGLSQCRQLRAFFFAVPHAARSRRSRMLRSLIVTNLMILRGPAGSHWWNSIFFLRALSDRAHAHSCPMVIRRRTASFEPAHVLALCLPTGVSSLADGLGFGGASVQFLCRSQRAALRHPAGTTRPWITTPSGVRRPPAAVLAAAR